MQQNQLQEVAAKMVAPHKGILAADESTPTIKKRFDSIGAESTEETRRDYREMLFVAPGVENYISGVIMFDETLRQSAKDGVSLSKLLTDRGIFPGIKVDQGTEYFEGSEVEKYTKGLDGLGDRLKEYYELGARFAKWRATYSVSDTLPSEECIERNAKDLAEYAFVCQQNNIVPIVEPEVLMNGDHTIEKCYEVTKRVLERVFAELSEKGVAIDGIILKPNMVISGQDSGVIDTPEKVSEMTIKCFHEVLPNDLPGITFLSGGQTEQQACANLNAMNSTDEMHPWEISFSYGRALQASALQAWSGKEENVEVATKVFTNRAKLVSLSRAGEYSSDMENGV